MGLARWLLLVVVSSAAGCSPSWYVVKADDPSGVFGPQPTFVVAPIDFRTMRMGEINRTAATPTGLTMTEREWIEGKHNDGFNELQISDQLARAKEAMNRGFIDGIRGGAKGWQIGASGSFTIKATVIELDPGYNLVATARNAVARVSVVIVDARGTELDEIVVRSEGEPSGFSMAPRLADSANGIGRRTAAFINARIAGIAVGPATGRSPRRLKGPADEKSSPCPSGQLITGDTAGHCCWPAQAWSGVKGACIGAPECASGFRAEGNECVVAECAPGQTITADTAGHCCWPAQAWSSVRNSCVGSPQCPAGMHEQSGGCSP